MAGLTSTGFEIKSLQDIQEEISDALKTEISPTLETDASTPLGQVISVFSSQLREVWELAQAVYSGQYPDSASGLSLTALAALTGTLRRPAYPSLATLSLSLESGFYAARSLVAHVQGDPTARFVNRDFIDLTEVIGASVVQAVFESEVAGPVRADANTLTVIAEPVVGWNAITAHPASALLGSAIETDAELRVRQQAELRASGSTTVDALRSDLLKVDGVISVTVLENVLDTTDANGLLPHSVEAIVLGGTNLAVAQTLFENKAAGINTNGNTTVSVSDVQNITHNIKLTRPAAVDMYLGIDLIAETDTFIGVQAVKDTLLAMKLDVGQDVIPSRLVAAIQALPGVEEVSAIRLGNTVNPAGTAKYVISPRHYAVLADARIVVNVTLI